MWIPGHGSSSQALVCISAPAHPPPSGHSCPCPTPMATWSHDPVTAHWPAMTPGADFPQRWTQELLPTKRVVSVFLSSLEVSLEAPRVHGLTSRRPVVLVWAPGSPLQDSPTRELVWFPAGRGPTEERRPSSNPSPRGPPQTLPLSTRAGHITTCRTPAPPAHLETPSQCTPTLLARARESKARPAPLITSPSTERLKFTPYRVSLEATALFLPEGRPQPYAEASGPAFPPGASLPGAWPPA